MGKYSAEKATPGHAEKDSTSTPARVPKRSWIEWLFGRRLSQKQEEQQEPSIYLPEPEKSSRGWIFNRRPYHEQINLQEKTIRGMSAKEFIRIQRERAEAHKKKNPFSQFLIEYFNIDHYTQYQELSAYYQKTKEVEMKGKFERASSYFMEQIAEAINRLSGSLGNEEKIKFLEKIDINREFHSVMERDIRSNPNLLLPTIEPLFDVVHAIWHHPQFNYREKGADTIGIIGGYTNAVKFRIELELAREEISDQMDKAVVDTLLKPICGAYEELFASMYSIFEISEMDEFGAKLDDSSRRRRLANKFNNLEEEVEENPRAGEQLMEAIRTYQTTIMDILSSYQHLSSSSSSGYPAGHSPLSQSVSPPIFSSSSPSSSSNPSNTVLVSKLREGIPDESCQAFEEKWKRDREAWLDLLNRLPPLANPNRMSHERLLKRKFRTLALRYHPDKNPQNLKAAEAAFQWIEEVYQKALLDGKSREDSKEWYTNYMAELAKLRKGWAEVIEEQDEIAQQHDEIRKGHDEIRKGHDEIRKGHDEIRKGHDEIRKGHDEILKETDRMEKIIDETAEQINELQRILDEMQSNTLNGAQIKKENDPDAALVPKFSDGVPEQSYRVFDEPVGHSRAKEAEKMRKRPVDQKAEKADEWLIRIKRQFDEFINKGAIGFFLEPDQEEKKVPYPRRLSAAAGGFERDENGNLFFQSHQKEQKMLHRRWLSDSSLLESISKKSF